MAPPKISICIPTYNGTEHLADCLASIQAQTFRDFEVVLCDDQSSDGTLDLARQLTAGDSRFRLIQNPTRFGLVGNWNNCVQRATGEWIKFVFQDDLILPECCERLLAACVRSGHPFGFCTREVLFEDAGRQQDRTYLEKNQRRMEELYSGLMELSPVRAAALISTEPTYNFVGEPTVTLIRRSLFDELGFFNPSLIQICDAEFWNRILVHHGAALVPERLAVFRVHPKATTARNLAKRNFRTNTLDPLIMLFLLAFSATYDRFRSSPGRTRSVLRLRSDCAVAAYRARKFARQFSTGEDSAASLLGEWHAVTRLFPRLATLAWIGWPLAAAAKVGRLVRPTPQAEVGPA